jgi:hypothetical protein
MNKIFSMLFVFLLLVACQSKKEVSDNTKDSVTIAEPETELDGAQITEEQKADGWKLLFDGKTTNGWRFYKNKPNNSWEVVDGTLHCKPFVDDKENHRADIMTVEQYENFELAFDWKISAQGNSGVMFRVTEEYDQPYFSGPEYQAMDDVGYPGKSEPNQLSGANYAMHAAPDARPNPVGGWNQSKLVVNGNHVEHWLNGTKVVEYELQSDDWKKRKAASKWKDEAGYGMAKKGHIDFQDHDHEVWFRNIMIKVL